MYRNIDGIEAFRMLSAKEITATDYLGKNCIVIYHKGSDTIALNKATGERAVAKCRPEDEFNFEEGAKIAFNRLLGSDVCEIIKVGDTVEVTEPKYTFSTYGTWKGLGPYKQNFVKHKLPVRDKKYKVLNIEKHGVIARRATMCALIQDPETTQVFIIGVDAIKKA